MNPELIHANDLLGGLIVERGPDFVSFTWNGASYKCSSGTGVNTKDLTFGGFDFNVDRVLVVQYSAFGGGAIPQLNQTLIFNPTRQLYRIHQIKFPEGEAQIHFGLISTSRGASGR